MVVFLRLAIFALLLSNPLLSSRAESDFTIIYAAEMAEANHPQANYAHLASLLAQHRNNDTPVFFLFGGGSIGPSPLGFFDRGAHIIDILNTLEPDAMAVSHRDFAYFSEELSQRAYEAAFPLVLSNLYDPMTEGNLDGLVDSILVQQGEIKLGVIALVAPYVIQQYALERLKITPAKQAILVQAAKLKAQGANLLVLMHTTELDFLPELLADGTIQLAFRNNYDGQQLLPDQPDIILQQKLNQALVVDAELVTAHQLNNLRTHAIDLATLPARPEVARQIQDHSQRLQLLLQEPLGLSTVAFTTRRDEVRNRENAFANFVADTLKNYTGAELAFVNSGTIRGVRDYPADTILTRGDILAELPFRNTPVLLELSGQDLRSIFEHGLSGLDNQRGFFLHSSGVTLRFDSTAPSGGRVKELLINGDPVVDDKMYKVATLQYLAEGGDGFEILNKRSKLNFFNPSDRNIADIIAAAIKKQQSIALVKDGRLQDVSQQEQP
ncbi:2',3'-cyclic-nucleotide 2'-phosphodiesterase/5'-or 3'-nucleotidase, 5'-nucleotidase family [Arsukibacterium tuosuense]|uniref:2',3'-cyclic-nucleotide 2'-phosphodiesterase/5'-or 3'-nucleotidase, 5'-nucleotidase family n=1 Tax=Arsukibacterium tuosuense TaxID=1323745 RepID=A0A285J4K0_9GAMM|nr:5'-nucleotidase C-terminal domain-containing protein [Arsukibacterium tuosuense]SNY54021.1 2',3'-cyclic-nucleotide 2'-phosphodiesterase/5'-or 3'-nucleotidase, 5'-nucleotidase family [Arsukibacterium tuosuense]